MTRVFCWGTFDIIHEGHRAFLLDAKQHGTDMYVIVASDMNVYDNKYKHPHYTQQKRIAQLNALGIADHIIPAGDDMPKNFERIKSLRPDVFIIGYDQDQEKRKRLEKYLHLHGVPTKFIVSKEFAGGIHSRHLRKRKLTDQ